MDTVSHVDLMRLGLTEEEALALKRAVAHYHRTGAGGGVTGGGWAVGLCVCGGPNNGRPTPACAALGRLRDLAREAVARHGASLLTLPESEAAAASREIAGWPGFTPSPLRWLPGLAKRAGVASIGYQDESGRLGLGSFKALAGAYAVFRHLAREIAAKTGRCCIPSWRYN